MNRSGAGGGGGGSGPTAAAAAAAGQKQKTLLQRVDNDIGNIVDNFSFLINVARVLFSCYFLLVFSISCFLVVSTAISQLLKVQGAFTALKFLIARGTRCQLRHLP